MRASLLERHRWQQSDSLEDTPRLLARSRLACLGTISFHVIEGWSRPAGFGPCVTMGMGYALAEGLHFRNGEILDRSFSTYKIPRFSWVPQVGTVLTEDRNSGLR